MRTQQQPAQGYTGRLQSTNALPLVSDSLNSIWGAIKQDVELFIRAGALDTPECYRSAVDALCELRKLTKMQARAAFQH